MVLQDGVQTDGPLPRVQPKDLKDLAMTLRRIERHLDSYVPAFLVSLSLFAAFATAGLGV